MNSGAPHCSSTLSAYRPGRPIDITCDRGLSWKPPGDRAEVEAEFDPETGVVTVYEGRREFRALERAARRGGLSKRHVREYLPYRMLEVEVAANPVYAWAAREIVARRVGEHAADGPASAEAIRLETQALRYRAHDKLMLAFLDSEVFEGGVYVRRTDGAAQGSLLEDT